MGRSIEPGTTAQLYRANRNGGGVGTSPGINPITPYTKASLDYRASWIAGDMVAKTFTTNPNLRSGQMAETMTREERSLAASVSRPVRRSVLPAPMRREGLQYVENNGMARSLSTNIPDHPTAIQVPLRASAAQPPNRASDQRPRPTSGPNSRPHPLSFPQVNALRQEHTEVHALSRLHPAPAPARTSLR